MDIMEPILLCTYIVYSRYSKEINIGLIISLD